jgi:hypothetical protein
MHPDNVGKQFKLFHGTDAVFSSGDVITPQSTAKDGSEGYGYAFATPDKEYAAEHGANVYEVEGFGDERGHPDNEDAVVSKVGFKVK